MIAAKDPRHDSPPSATIVSAETTTTTLNITWGGSRYFEFNMLPDSLAITSAAVSDDGSFHCSVVERPLRRSATI